MNPRRRSELGRWSAIGLGLSQRKRLTIAALVALPTAVVVAVVAPWQLAVLSGWDAAAMFIVGSIWLFIVRTDTDATREAALKEDLSAVNNDLIILVASVASLGGVILNLVEAKETAGILKAVMTTISVFTVVISWLTVHTIFTLRYAHLYFQSPEGGIDFNNDLPPDYLDFAYLAFTVGMTFQVSDTNISKRVIRRALTRHALLAYVFGTVIIGVTISVVVGLIQ